MNSPGVHDANPWLELDLGLNFTFFDKRLSVTPMLGTVHGSLLSSRGGTFPKGGGSRNERTTAFDGWVPNLIMNYLDDRLEGEFYMGYYKAGRSEGGSGGTGRPVRPISPIAKRVAVEPGTSSTGGPMRAIG